MILPEYPKRDSYDEKDDAEKCRVCGSASGRIQYIEICVQ
jgi:ribosomal protein S14